MGGREHTMDAVDVLLSLGTLDTDSQFRGTPQASSIWLDCPDVYFMSWQLQCKTAGNYVMSVA